MFWTPEEIEADHKICFRFRNPKRKLKNLQRSPTFDIVLGKDSESRPEILTIGEIQTLIEKAFESDHRWKRVWATALLTGMRSGELFALECSDVDFENRLINVNKSHNCRLKTIKSTKAGYWRQVPISEDLEKVLREQFAETNASEHVFPRISDWQRALAFSCFGSVRQISVL